MTPTAIGQPLRRVEDERFVRGLGTYVEDIVLAGVLHGAVLRSPHAHARIVSLDPSAALAMAGVIGVLTADDLESDYIGPMPCSGLALGIRGVTGNGPIMPARHPLARGIVRHVGEPIAFVVADSSAIAREAADLIAVNYAPLKAVVSAAEAGSCDAPQLWPEAPGNLSLTWENGDAAATEAAFARATHVARLETLNNRLIPTPIEARSALGTFDAGTGRFTLWSQTQGGHLLRRLLAESVFGVPENRVRVITPDVGGSFGMKMYLYPEQALVLWAARRFGRPIRWVADRSESFVADSHGRDQHMTGELALNKDGRILALRVRTEANMGAYLSTLAPIIPTAGGTRGLTGVYAIPSAHVRVNLRFTNTTPIDAYRGAGRPEAAFLIERLIEIAARETGRESCALRRLNMARIGETPHRTALGMAIDSGDFVKNLDDALHAADVKGFSARRAVARARGRYAGLGVSAYLEPCGGARDQVAEIRFCPSGSATVLIGSQSNGQGHETVYAQIVADRLHLPLDSIQVVQGDTDAVPFGRGTSGSRSLPIGGNALMIVTGRVLAKARAIAAHLLEASERDLSFAHGRFEVVGTDRAVPFRAVIEAAYEPTRLPPGMAPGLDEVVHHHQAAVTFPNGCHVCEIEIDGETGSAEIMRYTVVDDFGRLINPLLVTGQVHGGVAQGIGQALLEHGNYDRESGQLLTGSFMDYALPRADDLPTFEVTYNEVPCRTNPLGIKGCGEAGAIAAPAAVINALVDALAEFGVRHIEMPATPERLWRLIHGLSLSQTSSGLAGRG